MKTINLRPKGTFFLTVSTALLLLISSPALSQLTPKMIEAAKQEGEVNLYAAVSIKVAKKVGDMFEKKYGIKVKHWRGSATGIVNRVLNEKRAGKALFDVVIGNRGIMNVIKDNGVLTRYSPPEAEKYPAQFRDPTHWMTPWRVLPMGMSYNLNLVKSGEAPKTWEDLLEPRWRENFAMPNPAIHTTTLQFVTSLHKLLGEKWLKVVKGWGQQQPRLGRSIAPSVRTLIAGEVSVAIAYIKAKFQYGGPIDYVRMDKYLASVSALGVNKEAAHPNAGRLFINFFLEPEPLKIFAKIGEYVIHPDVQPRFKDVKLDQIVLMDVPTTVEMKTWQEKFKKIF
jgi:iron(III) transport system substrate-binding protein